MYPIVLKCHYLISETMPQRSRKVPFSGKAKKAQLQNKRERNETKQKFGSEDRMSSIPFSSTSEANTEENKIIVNAGKDKTDLLLDLQTSSHSGNKSGARRIQNNATRYELRFNQESKQDLAERREKARQPLKPIDSSDLVKTIDEYFPSSLDFPTRPEWNESMSKISMESNEARYFRKYVEDIFDKHENTQLSFFELNLETWRQLWRVIEKSDILLLVVDARYPAAMFPPSLYHYVISQKKHFILVLNKVDLIPGSLALAWKEYFKERFPEIHVTFFTSCPTYNLVTGVIASGEHSGLKFRRLRGRISMVTDGAKQIQEICKQIVETDQSKISPSDLNSWASKILKSDHVSDKRQENVSEVKIEAESDTSKVLTIGMLGQPNAGKSSLINSLMGKRVVSVSKTPGHTKHFQTIYITKFVVLCDCPGLVFPSLVPKQLQVLLGSFPISQVKEPFSVVQYIAERLNLPKILQIIHPENEVIILVIT